MNSASGGNSQGLWYHGVLTRRAAEELLMGSPDGVYLIRDSSTFNGDYTLSMSYKNKCRHYRMQWVTTPDNPNRRLTMDNKRFFNNVNDFIDSYSSRSQRALCCRLVRYLPKRPLAEGNDYVVLQLTPQRQLQMENRERMPTPPPQTTANPMDVNGSILEEIKTLKKCVEDLAKEQDRIEMWGRRKILLFHGVSESENENVVSAVLKIIRDTLRLQFHDGDMKSSYRIGQSNEGRPRPILVKFKDTNTRNSVWYNKVRLEGAGITMSEFLTKERYKAFAEARKRFGVTNCWTKDGVVVVIAADGARHRVTSASELKSIKSPIESIYN